MTLRVCLARAADLARIARRIDLAGRRIDEPGN
jgi:hypothetical protein